MENVGGSGFTKYGAATSGPSDLLPVDNQQPDDQVAFGACDQGMTISNVELRPSHVPIREDSVLEILPGLATQGGLVPCFLRRLCHLAEPEVPANFASFRGLDGAKRRLGTADAAACRGGRAGRDKMPTRLRTAHDAPAARSAACYVNARDRAMCRFARRKVVCLALKDAKREKYVAACNFNNVARRSDLKHGRCGSATGR